MLYVVKAMTDAGSDRSNAPQNFCDRAADYARAPFDRTQVLTVSYIYHAPLARNSSGFVGVVATPMRTRRIRSRSGLTRRPSRLCRPVSFAPGTRPLFQFKGRASSAGMLRC